MLWNISHCKVMLDNVQLRNVMYCYGLLIFFKFDFYFDESRRRLVADDVINEQISLELWKHLVHSYGRWQSAECMH